MSVEEHLQEEAGFRPEVICEIPGENVVDGVEEGHAVYENEDVDENE